MLRTGLAILLLIIPLPISAEHGDHIVIAEILIEGSAAKDEYVELYNPGQADVNLENWKLVKATASGNESNLVGAFPSVIIPAHGSLLICAPEAAMCTGRVDVTYTTSNSLAINNSVILKNANGVVIDRVGWGEATIREGTAAANPTENQSLERKPGGEGGNGQDTDDNAADFQLTPPNPQNRNTAVRPPLTGPTTPATPSVTPSGASTVSPPPPSALAPAKPKIKFNELYPNPPESDFDEFIELKNEGEITVDLKGWTLRDPNGVTFTFGESRAFAPNTLLVITRQISGLALRNSGGKVELLDPNEKREDSVSYDGPVAEGVAYARDENGKWKWTTKITPTAANEIATPNRPPVIVLEIPTELSIGKPVTLDASDTNDPDGDTLVFVWTLPEGAHEGGPRFTLTQLAPTKMILRLTVRDNHGNESHLERKLTFGKPAESAPPGLPTIRFSEIMPNPEGLDAGEWLEIENIDEAPVALAGYKISAGSKTHELPEGVSLPTHGFVILAGPTLKISLPNVGGTLTLANPTGTILDTFAYPKLAEGTGYARTSAGTWSATTLATPGAANMIQTPSEKTTTKKISTPIRDISPEEIYDLPLETHVRIEGTVTAPLGLLGATRFALAGALLETRQEVGHLKTGQRLRVTGTIRDRSDLRVVYIGKANEITVLGNAKLAIPRAFNPEETNVEEIGTLVKIEGVVQTRRGRNLSVKVDEQEVSVALPETLEEKFSKDTPIVVTGILTKNTKGWRIVARNAHDITILQAPISYKPEAISPALPFTIPLRQRPPTMTLVFLASLIGLGLVGIGLWIYERPRPIPQPIYAPGEPLTPHVETVDIPITASDREVRA